MEKAHFTTRDRARLQRARVARAPASPPRHAEKAFPPFGIIQVDMNPWCPLCKNKRRGFIGRGYTEPQRGDAVIVTAYSLRVAGQASRIKASATWGNIDCHGKYQWERGKCRRKPDIAGTDLTWLRRNASGGINESQR